MIAEIKAAWVAALRSGDYKQGRRVLHNSDTNTYCCLGVLCDLAEKAGVISSHVDALPSGVKVTVFQADGDAKDESHSLLPKAVGQWAGLAHPHPSPVAGGTVLSRANDDDGASFTAIADLIEEFL